LLLSEKLYRAFLPDLSAREAGGGSESKYGKLWEVESERVQLPPVLAAIESIHSASPVKPPDTGDAGLR
jgi:hypothetical protein